MRAAILAFAMSSVGLLCPACHSQTNTLSPTTGRAVPSQASTAAEVAPAVQTLELKETSPLAYPMPQAIMGAKCDRNGNLFVPVLEFDSDGTTRSEVLVEILSDSKSTKVFGSQALPASDYPNQSIKYFDVDPGGTVYALVVTYRNVKTGDKQRAIWQYFIERFNSDGSSDSVVHLDYPPGTDPGGLGFYHFGVFRDGSFIVAGTKWAPSTGAEPLTAVYDSQGKFIQTVRLPDDVLGDPTMKPGGVSRAQRDAAVLAIMVGSMVSSPDGNVYLLRNSQPVRIYGVDSAGQVVKHFQLSPPAPGMSVSSAGLAGEDSLFLYFGHPVRAGEKPISEYLAGIFNTVSGRFDAIYKLPTKGLRVPASSDQHGGLLFIGSTEDDHLAVFDYGP